MIVNDEPRPTDADVAAQWAAEALRDGRYELGAALANIARNAHRAALANRAHDTRTEQHERTAAAERARMVPLYGQTREEFPRTPMYDASREEPATPAQVTAETPGSDEQPPALALAQEAATEMFGRPTSPVPPGPLQRRCNAEVIREQGNERYREECHAGVWWDDDAPPGTVRWRHMDPALDSDHAAVVLANGQG